MKLIFTVLVSIMAIEKAISTRFNINNICIGVKNRCKGLYEYNLKYQIKCEKKACKGKLSYDCGSDYCDKNKHSCEIITNLRFLIKAYKSLLLFEKELEKYSHIIERINYCAIDAYSLQPDDICINGDGCYSVSRFSFKIGMNRITKPIICRCPANQTYHCGEKFCAVHSDACLAFNKTHSSSFIRNCDNGNQIIKKILFF